MSLEDRLRLAEQSRKYYDANKVRLTARRRELYQQNKVEILKRRKEIRESNPERTRQYALTNRTRHKEAKAKIIEKWHKSDRGKESSLKSSNKMRELYPEKYRARYMLRNAVRLGKVKKGACQDCNNSKVEAHHHLGYSEEHWYDVLWLCRKHHTEAHRAGIEDNNA